MKLRYDGESFDDIIPVPPVVSECPECGGKLYIQINEWDADTGVPTDIGVEVDCERDDLGEKDPQNAHRWWQGEWMDTLEKVRAWAVRFVRVDLPRDAAKEAT